MSEDNRRKGPAHDLEKAKNLVQSALWQWAERTGAIGPLTSDWLQADIEDRFNSLDPSCFRRCVRWDPSKVGRNPPAADPQPDRWLDDYLVTFDGELTYIKFEILTRRKDNQEYVLLHSCHRSRQ